MSINRNKLLLDELQNVLQKQIELAQQGNIGEVEALVKQAGFLMERISDLGILKLPEYKNYQEKLQRLYKELCLALAAQKAEVAGQLNRIRKGKKSVEVYRGSI